MRLPACLPRLSRKQKVLRNLLAVVLLAFLVWAVNDFHAPTANIALRWRAEEYGLPAPEVLYRGEWERGRRDVVFRAGGFYGTAIEYKYGWLEYVESDFQLAEPEGPVVFLQENGTMDPEAVYVYADLPEDARAVCALRLREIVNGRAFDETYTMEAEPNAHGLYRFPLERKYSDGVLGTAEKGALRVFQSTARGSGDPDFICEVTVTFYDAAGNEVHTYEKDLWPVQRGE